jgi:putative signal transducing protein
MGMVKLIEPYDEGELALIKSLLEGNDIPYFVQNEHFGSLYPGLALPFNARVVMVDESDLGRAETLLGELTAERRTDEAG